MSKTDFDAVVVGSGPNGLAAAIRMQQKGISVLLIEGSDTIGGGLRSAGLTLPGFVHDVCSAVHPLALSSPFFSTLPLSEHDLEYIQPPLPAAHPFDGGSAAVLTRSLEQTAGMLGQDEEAYIKFIQPILNDWPLLINDILAPLHFPEHAIRMAKFGMSGLASASRMAKKFETKEARGLWAGMAAHSAQPFSNFATSAIALVLMVCGHTVGWPIPKGGAQSIANSLAAYFVSIGGKIETGSYIRSLSELPATRAVLMDVTPRQLLSIAGERFSMLYRFQLSRYRYGAGVFKIDWALNGPIPFTAVECRYAGTVHLGNTLEEITASERDISKGRHPEKPFVLLAQPSLFDHSRAPEGKHTAWAYCHVPNGSTVDMTNAIEKQVERFAPGFRDLILARHTMNTLELESFNSNLIGGDVNGGVLDITQLFTRPALRFSPYRTSADGIYICSSSTPPGGGVHGMCGFHAAERAMKDVFKI